MKKNYILSIILFSLNCSSQNCNIGNQTTTPSFTTSSIAGNYILGVRFTLSQAGTLKTINLLGNNTGVGLQTAVYNDNAGVPNNLIASSNFGTVGSGVISLPVTPTVIPAGNYWIMAVYQNSGNHVNYNRSPSGNNVYYKAHTYGAAIAL